MVRDVTGSEPGVTRQQVSIKWKHLRGKKRDKNHHRENTCELCWKEKERLSGHWWLVKMSRKSKESRNNKSLLHVWKLKMMFFKEEHFSNNRNVDFALPSKGCLVKKDYKSSLSANKTLLLRHVFVNCIETLCQFASSRGQTHWGVIFICLQNILKTCVTTTFEISGLFRVTVKISDNVYAVNSYSLGHYTVLLLAFAFAK